MLKENGRENGSSDKQTASQGPAVSTTARGVSVTSAGESIQEPVGRGGARGSRAEEGDGAEDRVELAARAASLLQRFRGTGTGAVSVASRRSREATSGYSSSRTLAPRRSADAPRAPFDQALLGVSSLANGAVKFVTAACVVDHVTAGNPRGSLPGDRLIDLFRHAAVSTVSQKR